MSKGLKWTPQTPRERGERERERERFFKGLYRH